MRFVIDMNLSPSWVDVFAQRGWEGLHWSQVGDPRAEDVVIMHWARAEGYIVFTHDLDFSTLLAVTRAEGPSVIQVRTQDVMPESLGRRLVYWIEQYELELESGALLTIDEHRSRIRILPLRR
jgi:predicted nuclease of predicted toxin-antitoxin system